MDSKKINQLATNVAPNVNDLTVVGDATSGELKKITLNQIASLFGSVGGVSSVSMTVPTGLTVTGSPITTSGTLALTLTAGYSIPTTAKQSEWDTGYAERLKWDGGSSGLNAATARTSLGLVIGTDVLGYRTFGSAANNNTGDFATAAQGGNADTAYSLRITGASLPLSISANNISITQASTTANGYLSSTDWNTFNGKQNALGFTPYNSTNPAGYLSSVSLTTNVTGTLPIANGGTNSTTASAARTALGLEIGTNVLAYRTFGTAANNNTSDFYSSSNPSGFISGITSTNVTDALGYTPYNSSNPAGYTTNTGTVTSVSGTGTVSGLTLSGSFSTSGTLTLGGTLSLTSLNITNGLGFTPYNATNPNGYISGNQTITLSGDVSGSGTTSITTTIGNSRVTNVMLAGGIDLTTKVTGLLPDGNISSASNWNSKQAQLNGTGFIKASGTTISYDNSTYLTTSSASSTYLPFSGGTLSGNLNGTSANFSGNITVSSGNATGGGIILADDGDIVDLNDSYCSMRFSGGVRIFSANRGGTPNITLYNTGAIAANGNISAANFSGSSSGTNTGDQTLSGLGGQPQLNGTGFVKASGTTISYDNSTYYLASNPSNYITSSALSGYLPLSGGTLSGALSYNVGDGTNWFISSVANGAELRLKSNGGASGYSNRSGALAWKDNAGNKTDILGWTDDSIIAYQSLSATSATFSSSVTATSFFESSDSRLKILVKDYEQPKGIENVAARFYVKNSKQELGYFAQDLQEILPSAVVEGDDGFLSLSYTQVHTAKIAHLEKEIAELKELIKSLL